MSQDWQKLTVAQLKEELQTRGLPVSGKKAELVERLIESDASSSKAADDSPAAAPTTTRASADDREGAPAPKRASDSTGKGEISEAERVALRKQRFGDAVLTDEEKRRMREERFNLVDPLTDEERQKQRALRFGIETEAIKQDKIKERAKRFNLHDPLLEEDKKKARMARFEKAPVEASKPATVADLQSLIKKRS